MDRYKHISAQRRIKHAPNPAQTENPGNAAGIPTTDDPGALERSNLSMMPLPVLTVTSVFHANMY